jgi:hypothetical protein
MTRRSPYASLKRARAVALVVGIVAFLMVIVTAANGGPISTRDHPHLALSIAFAISFWGLVVTGAGYLLLAMVQAVRGSRRPR